jgi:hypothetical protein
MTDWLCSFFKFMINLAALFWSLFYFILYISFIGHRNSRLQGERPMGLVQTGKRDPCKAQPLNKVWPDNKKKKRSIYSKYIRNAVRTMAGSFACEWPSAWHISTLKVSLTKLAYFETRTGLGLGPGLGLEENPDSRKTRTRTRKKSGLVFKKPGLDFWKPVLEIEKNGFKTRTLLVCTRMQRFVGKV